MKKTTAVHFSFCTHIENIDNYLTKIMNEECPEGYHFKQLLITQLEMERLTTEEGIIVYEED